MRKLWRYIWRRLHRRPAAPKQTALERKLERQWADMLRYEGRPLHDDQD